MTWGSQCSMCGLEDCSWVDGGRCEGRERLAREPDIAAWAYREIMRNGQFSRWRVTEHKPADRGFVDGVRYPREIVRLLPSPGASLAEPGNVTWEEVRPMLFGAEHDMQRAMTEAHAVENAGSGEPSAESGCATCGAPATQTYECEGGLEYLCPKCAARMFGTPSASTRPADEEDA